MPGMPGLPAMPGQNAPSAATPLPTSKFPILASITGNSGVKGGTQNITRLYAIARIGQARQALADMLVCYSRLLQSNDDVNSRTQLRTELAALLIDKDPDLLDCVLDIAGKERKNAGPRVLELFDGLNAIARHYREAGVAEDDPAWTDLLGMSDRLLVTYQRRVEEIIPQLKIEDADPRIVPEWLVTIYRALKSVTASDKLPGILAQSPAYLLDGRGFSMAVDALEELVVAHMEAEAETLTAHLCSALATASKEDRIKAVAGLSLMIENSMDQSARTVIQLEDALQDGCARETSESVLKPFVTYLFERMVVLFNRGYYARATKHAETIGLLDRSLRKAIGEDAINSVREAGAELAKTAWAQSLAEQLMDGGEKEACAAKILSVIDRNLATTLIACIGREDNIERAQQLARHLKQLCPGSAKSFVALMSSQNDPTLLARMMAVAPYIGGEDEILEIMHPLLTHQNFDLRATALQYILERDNDRTSAFVSSRLRDPRNAPQRELWMSILTKLRHPSAAQVIINELQTEIDSPLQDDRRMMALIEACGAHDDARIGSVLARFLRPATGLSDTRRITTIQRDNGKALRFAAMKGLIRYTKDPRVYETFDRLRRDSDPDIARMAAYCMNPSPEMLGRPSNVPSAFISKSNRTGGTALYPVNKPVPQEPPPAKPRKGFEELEQQSEVDAIFQPGASISGSGKQKKLPPSFQTPIPGAFQSPVPGLPPAGGSSSRLPAPPPSQVQFSGKQSPLDPAQLPDDLFAGQTPLLEGELQELGLGMTARITCAKNGVMTIKSSLGTGAIYIQNKAVVAAFFSGMSDIQALAAIGKLKQAQFAYYAKTFSYAASMSVEVSTIETAVREYLDMR